MKVVVKIGKNIKRWWKEFTMDADQAYVNRATDIVDLERRLNIVSRGKINKV